MLWEKEVGGLWEHNKIAWEVGEYLWIKVTFNKSLDII